MRSFEKIECKKQHTPETCGAACIMTVLHFFKKGNCPSRAEEVRLYKEYGCKALGRGTVASSIVKCFVDYGLDTAIYHSAEDYLMNLNSCIPEEIFQKVLADYKEELIGIQNQVTIETDFKINTSWYKEQLEAGYLLLVEYVIPGETEKVQLEQVHWIIIYGYKNGRFLVCDPRPLVGKTTITEDEIARNTNTPLGSICIVVRER